MAILFFFRSFNNPGNDPNWELKNLGGDITSSWNDIGQNAWNKSKPITPIWQEHSDPLNNDWANHSGFNKMANKINPNDFIRNSKQYKYLCDMGFKMDEVELVLRKTNLNLDESLGLYSKKMARNICSQCNCQILQNCFNGAWIGGDMTTTCQGLINNHNLPGVFQVDPGTRCSFLR